MVPVLAFSQSSAVLSQARHGQVGSTRLCLAGSAPVGLSSTDLARLSSIHFGLAWPGVAPFASPRLGYTQLVLVCPAGVRFAFIFRRWMSLCHGQVWDNKNVDEFFPPPCGPPGANNVPPHAKHVFSLILCLCSCLVVLQGSGAESVFQ